MSRRHEGFVAQRRVPVRVDRDRTNPGISAIIRSVGWHDSEIERALRPLIERYGRWPTIVELDESELLPLYRYLSSRGELARWRAHFGVVAPSRGRSPTWTEQAVEAALRELIAELGQWPTYAQLQVKGLGGLSQAIERYGGRERWARHFDVDSRARSGNRVDDDEYSWERGEPSANEIRDISKE